MPVTLATSIPRATDPGGSVFPGVISGVGATRTLVAGETGSTCLFDSASGVVYTLPPPSPGLTFTFVTSVTITSNAAKFITSQATEFLLGAVAMLNNAAATGEAFSANGTTHRASSSNGTTTGGIIGDRITVKALNSTQWLVDGVMVQSGTAATPFATS